MSTSPTIDAAIAAMKKAAKQRGVESIMTTDPNGNVLIMLGADDPDKHGRLQACMVELAMKEPSL